MPARTIHDTRRVYCDQGQSSLLYGSLLPDETPGRDTYWPSSDRATSFDPAASKTRQARVQQARLRLAEALKKKGAKTEP